MIGSLLSLVTLSVMVGYLGQSGFGVYSTALAFVFLFNYLADFGLYSYLVREISRAGAAAKKLVSNVFTLRLAALLLFGGAAPVVAFAFPYDSELRLTILIMTMFFVFSSLSQVLMGVFQRFLRTDLVTFAEIVGRVAQLGLVVWFVSLDVGLASMAGALSLSALAACALTFGFARRFVPFTLGFDFKLWKSVLKESWPIGVAVVFTVLYFKLDTVILSLYQPDAHVGIYNMGYRILEALVFFPAMFVGLIMPMMSHHADSALGVVKTAAQQASAKLQVVVQRTLNVLIFVTLPLAALLIVRAGDIIALIDRKAQFNEAAGVLAVLAIALVAIYFGALFSNALIALHKQRILMKIYAFGAAFNIILNFLIIPRHSYLGASWTTVATEIAVTILMILVLSKAAKPGAAVSVSWARALPVVAATAIMTLVLIATPSIHVILAAALAGLAYLAVAWLLKGIAASDIAFIRTNTTV